MSPERSSLPDQNPLVSIILVTYNGGRVLEPCLHSLNQLQWKHLEFIIVDNASTDDTLKKVAGSLPSASVIRLEHNQGYGAGGNAGARIARGDLLFFMNQDVALSPEFLNGIVSTMGSDERIAICGGRVLTWDGKTLVSIGQVFERWTGYGLDLGFGSKQLDFGRNVREVFSPNGSAFVVKRDVFNRIGGFNEQLFMYFDETDLSWRARMAGMRVTCSQGSILRHMIDPARAHRAWSRYYIDRNSLLCAVQNYEFSSLIMYFPTSFISRLAEIIAFRVLGRKEQAQSALRALTDFIARLPKAWRERAKSSKIRKVSDREVLRRDVLASPRDILTVFSVSVVPHTQK